MSISEPNRPLTTVRRAQLADQVIAQISGRIQSGELGMGARLPSEFALMEQLGVGRSTLREAVRVLAHAGVLEVRQGDGTYVRAVPGNVEPLAQRLRRARVTEVDEARRPLELEAVRLAALRHTDADLVTIAGHLERRRTATANGDSVGLLDADIDFHMAVAAATQNAVLSELYQIFARSLREALDALSALIVDGEPQMAQLHEALFAAIADRDPDRAYAITTQILETNEAALRAFAADT